MSIVHKMEETLIDIQDYDRLPSGKYIVDGILHHVTHGDKIDGVLVIAKHLYEKRYGEFK